MFAAVRVKFNEIDSMRRVWHGAYVTYFEDGRESFGRHYPGIGYADMQRSGIYAPIYDLTRGSMLRWHWTMWRWCIHVMCTIPVHGWISEYKVYREADGVLCAEGSTVQLFIDVEGMLMVDLPDYYKEWQERYVERGDNHP